MRKLFLLFNPFSGKAQVRTRLVDIIDVFVKGGYEVYVHPTQKRRDASKQVPLAVEMADILVCCGGDGTLDETVDGLMRASRQIPVGYIPAGSTNDFASSLMISRNMVEAAQQIVDGQVRYVDVGRFNDRYFVYVAAFGMFTEVSYQTDQNMKNVLGYLAYLLEGMKSVFDIKAYDMQFSSEEGVFEGSFIYGMITNSKSVGGMKHLTGSHVELDDGLFEVTLIRAPQNPLEMAEVIGCLMALEDTTPLIETFKTRRLEVISREAVSWTLDGEFGGTHDHLVIRNQQKALPIILPETMEEETNE